MSSSFTNQVMAQIELFTNTSKYALGVCVLLKWLDEKVARLHRALGARLTPLSPEQAAYIGCPARRPVQVGPLSVLGSSSVVEAGGSSEPPLFSAGKACDLVRGGVVHRIVAG
jgi:hypothetical protein